MPPTPPSSPWPFPALNLDIKNLDHAGVEIFLNAVKPKQVLQLAVQASFELPYTPETVPRNVQEITLRLMPMPGVAHTFGSATHKTIEFSLEYIAKIAPNRAGEEITGVIVHEVVHCYQYNGLQSCPGGLIEGVADFVRLNTQLAPPHWAMKPGKTWDAGYEKTAYFLNWLETCHGAGTVRTLNERLKNRRYSHDMFRDLTGQSVDGLWRTYCEFCGEKPEDGPSKPEGPTPGHGVPSTDVTKNGCCVIC